MAQKSRKFPLPNLNVDTATFECSFGKGCEGVCCQAGRPPVTEEEKKRIDDNLDKFLPHLTPAARKEVEDAGLQPGGTRRQVTVRDVDLNSLVGKRFRVGEVECLGVELCEPCRHLEEMTRPGIIKELTHRAGINADILTDGTISVGDEVVELS